jgi:hypothetical protein
MFNQPTQEQLDTIPRLYGTEHIPLFIAETDGCDICFGFAMLGDMQNAEWGYISLNELKSIRVAGGFEVDNDLYWTPKAASEVEIIRRAHRWVEQGGECYV